MKTSILDSLTDEELGLDPLEEPAPRRGKKPKARKGSALPQSLKQANDAIAVAAQALETAAKRVATAEEDHRKARSANESDWEKLRKLLYIYFKPGMSMLKDRVERMPDGPERHFLESRVFGRKRKG